MPQPNQTPDSLIPRIGKFLSDYQKALAYHAAFLDMTEQSMTARREESPHDPDIAPEGLYSRQAGYLRAIAEVFTRAVADQSLPVQTPDERMALQGTFNHAVGALNIIIQENAELNGRMARGSDPKRLERKYRKKHDIREDEALEPKVEKHIAKLSRFNQQQNREISGELMELSNMKEELNQIRAVIFRGRPTVGGSEDLVSR